MKFILTLTLTLTLTLSALLQPLIAQEHPLSAFENLVGKTWIVEGEWGDGSRYKKESVFEFALDKTLVIEKSRGFTDSLQTVFGDRNYGIRRLNPKDSTLSFSEYDILAGSPAVRCPLKGRTLAMRTHTKGTTSWTNGSIKTTLPIVSSCPRTKTEK